jgi:hypoxanthine phosphoribosyltransferase
MTDKKRLEFSIPANNHKIIEIYNRLRNDQLKVNADYQRKLVWKRPHKENFIDTILRNYPFPEIYLAPGMLDDENLILIDEIVDGQQRLTTIRDYIEETDIFALENHSIPKFSQLDSEARKRFLNYEISVRYLKDVSAEEVREIFQRINKTDYSLNATERWHAQYGDSEFVCFAKQLLEENFDVENVLYVIPESERMEFVSFFHGEEENEGGVFSETDISRMYALQYIMTLVATLDSQEYFARYEKLITYIKAFNESFNQGPDLKDRLLAVIRFIRTLPIKRASRWYKKANLFTLIVELDKTELSSIDAAKLGGILTQLDWRVSVSELGLETSDKVELSPREQRYFAYAREAVNQKTAREFRGEFIATLIKSARID